MAPSSHPASTSWLSANRFVFAIAIGVGIAATASAGSSECRLSCDTPEPSYFLASNSDYLERQAERDAERARLRMQEDRRRAQRDSERRARRKLSDLERKIERNKREQYRSSGYGHRSRHGSNDGQAGTHCMYGTDGALIYAPSGARCATKKGGPMPGPASVQPVVRAGCASGNCRNGDGTYVWTNGTRYVGDFANGLQHGQGSIAFTNGASYVGGWEAGKRSGMGTAIYPDGRVRAGRWKENRFLGTGAADAAPSIEWPDLSRPAATVGGGEHDVAVIVGIERYAHVADIPGAEQNAVDWVRYMLKTRGVPSDRVALLLDEDATREEIRYAVEDAARRVGRKGRLWFVFIGHGAPSTSGDDGLLIGFDAQQKARSLSARSLEQSDLLEILESSKANQIHVLIDACFSGRNSAGQQLVAGLQPLVVTSTQPTTDDRMTLMTAAASDQFAGPLPGASRPAFSYLMLGGLRGWADADGDGRVSAGELHDYAAKTMRSTIRGRNQTPTFVGETDMRLGRSPREAGPDVVELMLRSKRTARSR